MIFLTRKQQLQHRFDITNNPIAHKSLQNVFFEVTKGCMGSLEFLGLNDRVRDGVRNRAKVQLTGDFPPSTPHKRSKVTVGLTLSDSIQTHTSLSCEPSLQQQTSRYATVSLESHWHCTAFQRLVLHIYMSAKALVFNVVASTLGY